MKEQNNKKGLTVILKEVRQLKAEGQFEQALDTALKALAAYKHPLERHPSGLRVIREVDNTRRFYINRKIKKGLEGKGEATKIDLGILGLMAEILPVALLYYDSLLPVLICRIAGNVARFRPCPYTALGYTGFAYIALRYMEDDYKAALLQEKAEKFLQQFPNGTGAALSGYFIGSVTDALRHETVEVSKWLSVGTELAETTPLLAQFKLLQAEELYFFSGKPIREGLINTDKWARSALTERFYLRHLMIEEMKKFLTEGEDAVVPMDDTMTDGYDRTRIEGELFKGMLSIHYGRMSEGMEHIVKAYRQIRQVKVYMEATQIYYYYGVALAGCWFKGKKRKYRQRMGQVVSIFSDWYKVNPKRFDHMHGLLLGMLQVMNGKQQKGLLLMEAAVSRSEVKSNDKDRALGLQMLALVHRYVGNEKTGDYYALEAAGVNRSWGALGVAKVIESQLNIEVGDLSEPWQLSETMAKDGLYYNLQIFEKVLADSLQVPLGEAFRKWALTESHCEAGRYFTLRDGDWFDEEGTLLEQMSECGIKAVRHCINHDVPVLVNRDRVHTVAKYDGYIMDHFDRSILVVPLGKTAMNGKVFYMEKGEDFEEEEVDLVTRLAEQVGFVMSIEG